MHRSSPRRIETAHVETLHGELCIYEWTSKTVHALNPSAARVWALCDGRTTIDEMIAALGDVPGAASIVQQALAQFDRAGLLEQGSVPAAAPVLSRRAMLGRVGIAAAIPVVTSIVAPTPAAAQSGTTMTFTNVDGPQSFMVPAGVTSITVDVLGASGAGLIPQNPPGPRGRVQATLPVTAGEVLTIMCGGAGFLTGTGGFNGGGNAGTGGTYGGGGASDIRRGGTFLVVGGGGGCGGFCNGAGGAGGGLTGGTGTGSCGTGGGGGTQIGGGTGGTTGGVAGVAGVGGKGGDGVPTGSGGGGGG